MPIEKKPFVNYTLDEDKDPNAGKIIPIRFNKQELEELKADQDMMDIDREGTAIKALVDIGRNVIRTQLSGSTIQHLFKKKRTRR